MSLFLGMMNTNSPEDDGEYEYVEEYEEEEEEEGNESPTNILSQALKNMISNNEITNTESNKENEKDRDINKTENTDIQSGNAENKVTEEDINKTKAEPSSSSSIKNNGKDVNEQVIESNEFKKLDTSNQEPEVAEPEAKAEATIEESVENNEINADVENKEDQNPQIDENDKENSPNEPQTEVQQPVDGDENINKDENEDENKISNNEVVDTQKKEENTNETTDENTPNQEAEDQQESEENLGNEEKSEPVVKEEQAENGGEEETKENAGDETNITEDNDKEEKITNDEEIKESETPEEKPYFENETQAKDTLPDQHKEITNVQERSMLPPLKVTAENSEIASNEEENEEIQGKEEFIKTKENEDNNNAEEEKIEKEEVQTNQEEQENVEKSNDSQRDEETLNDDSTFMTKNQTYDGPNSSDEDESPRSPVPPSYARTNPSPKLINILQETANSLYNDMDETSENDIQLEETKEILELEQKSQGNSPSEEPIKISESSQRSTPSLHNYPAENEEENNDPNNQDDDIQQFKPNSYSMVQTGNPRIVRPSQPTTPRPAYPRKTFLSRSAPIMVYDPPPKDVKEKALKLKPIKGLKENDYNALILDFQKDKGDRIESGRFMEVHQLNRAITYVNEVKTQQIKEDNQKQVQSQYEQDLENIKTELSKYDAKTKEIEKQIKEKHQQQTKLLQQKQQDELQETVGIWKSDAKIRLYNHASPALLNHRKQLEKLISQNRFDDASQFQQIIKGMEQREAKKAHLQMQKDYKEVVKMIKARHEEEMNDLIINQNALLKIEQKKRADDRVYLANILHKLEVKKEVVSDPEKLWIDTRVHRMHENNLIDEPSRISTRSPRPLTAATTQRQPIVTIPLPPLDFEKL